MVAEINSEVKSAILALSSQNFSHRKIAKILSGQGMTVSNVTVSKLLKSVANGIPTTDKKPRALGTQNLPSVRTESFVQKIKMEISVANPPSLNEMSKKYGVAKSTIHTIIHRDIGARKRCKVKTHSLSDKQVQQRVDKGPRFRKHLTGNKYQYILTLDEAWKEVSNEHKHRKIYYETDGNPVPESWTKTFKSKHPKKVMYVGGICHRGQTELYYVPEKRKVNADFFIHHILTPIVEKDIPRLYCSEKVKVVLHFDSAPRHVANKTYEWLNWRRIKFIPKEDWPSNSSDLSPMDYGIFKNLVWKWKATDLTTLKRAMTRVWNQLDIGIIRKTLDSWLKRVDLMISKNGLQIENSL